MGRPSNKEARRAEIVDGLRLVMAETGYERATIADIAGAAGLAPGLVHYHFGSKEEILLALVDALVAGAEARIERRLARADTPRSKLDAVIDGLLARGDDEDGVAVACWTQIGAEAVRNAEVRGRYAAWIHTLASRLRSLFIAACHAEGLSGEGAIDAAAALVALIEGFFQLAATVPDAIRHGSAAAAARRMAHGLIEAQPRRS